MKILIPLHPFEDKGTWHYTKNGKFYVRSAYFVELEERKKERETSFSRNDSEVRHNLWRANIPTKIPILVGRPYIKNYQCELSFAKEDARLIVVVPCVVNAMKQFFML